MIELLVVISFLAILTSIAISRYSGLRSLAQDAAIKSDLQNAMKAEEGWYSDAGSYAAFDIQNGGTATEPPIQASAGVDLTGTLIPGGVRIVGSHDGTDSTWCISTDSGKVVQGSTC